MSNITLSYLKTNPLLTKYAQLGLVNINSLARYIKTTTQGINKNDTVASIGMNIRRYISHLPSIVKPSINTNTNKLHVVTRANLEELIFTKNSANRQVCLDLFHQLNKTKYFSCLVEGEKEIVLLADCVLNGKLSAKKAVKNASYHTTGLGYISIDFSINLREIVGIYGCITSALASANISIHSFHTIGGEILILVRNDDLIKAQEVLTSTLKTML